STKKRSFLDVTAHWINDSLERESVTLACRRFHSPHTYIRIAELINEINHNFNIDCKKITATITDNGSNFLKAFKEYGVKENSMEIVADVEEEFVAIVTDDHDDTFDSNSNNGSDEDILTTSNNENIDQDLHNCLPNHLKCAAHTISPYVTTDVTKFLKRSVTIFRIYPGTSFSSKALLITGHGRELNAFAMSKDTATTTPPSRVPCSTRSLRHHIASIVERCRRNPYCPFAMPPVSSRKVWSLLTTTLSNSFPASLNRHKGDKNAFYGMLLPCLVTARRKLKNLTEEETLTYCKPLAECLLASFEKRFQTSLNLSTPESEAAAIAALSYPAFKNKWLRCIPVEKHEKILRAFKTIVAKQMDALLIQSQSNRPQQSCSFSDYFDVYSNESSVRITELSTFMEKLADSHDQLHGYIGNYAISEDRIKALSGYCWAEINIISNMLISIKKSENRNKVQAVVVFLYKLRSGLSNQLISAALGVQESVVTASVNSVLKSFEKDVLPTRFGLKAFSRQEFISQTSLIAKKLHNIDNNLAIICDGTYVRHQKSANNSYQRKSYSGQKKPHYNDAQILQYLLQQPDGLSELLERDDIFILDRGFRDVRAILEEKGFKVLMPALKGKKNQLTTAESNQSRLVTKVRWVVEAIHGIIGQKYKLLHNQFQNTSLPNLSLYCKIVCFLQNTFGKRLNSDEGTFDHIIDRLHASQTTVNSLAVEVEEKNWNRKFRPFIQMSSNDLFDFPEMTLEDLKLFFTGSYQMKQAISYLAEMMGEDDSLRINYVKDIPIILSNSK
ncbi:hypothetical protein ALC57_07916, partial [Trachymyrmex cornetzi]